MKIFGLRDSKLTFLDIFKIKWSMIISTNRSLVSLGRIDFGQSKKKILIKISNGPLAMEPQIGHDQPPRPNGTCSRLVDLICIKILWNRGSLPLFEAFWYVKIRQFRYVTVTGSEPVKIWLKDYTVLPKVCSLISPWVS